MILVSEDDAMVLALGTYAFAFIGTPLLARHKHLGAVMHLAGILGPIGLLVVASAAPRCRDCRQPLPLDEGKVRWCPRCQEDAPTDRVPDHPEAESTRPRT
jgi:hypothetical protein